MIMKGKIYRNIVVIFVDEEIRPCLRGRFIVRSCVNVYYLFTLLSHSSLHLFFLNYYKH